MPGLWSEALLTRYHGVVADVSMSMGSRLVDEEKRGVYVSDSTLLGWIALSSSTLSLTVVIQSVIGPGVVSVE